MQSSILVVKCSDQIGIIARVSGLLSEHGYNIISLSEHADKDSNRFFMRVEVTGEINPSLLPSIEAILPKNADVFIKSRDKKRLVLLATKETHCLGDILLQAQFGDLNATVVAVIANHNDLKGLSEVFNVPFYCISHVGKDQIEHEREIITLIDNAHADLVVLAKYMRVLSDNFVRRYDGKLVNIHHSFLPAFIGARPYHQAFARGVKLIGATAHFVTEVLDDGPIISQNVTKVSHAHSVHDLKAAGRIVEQTTLTEALRLIIDDKVFQNDNKTVVFE